MTDNTEAIIKLAEWIGWTSKTDKVTGRVNWYKPGAVKATTWGELSFDPYTDANDCEALMTHLDGQGYTIKISTGKGFAHVCLIRRKLYPGGKTNSGQRFDYKQSICELALKVINNASNVTKKIAKEKDKTELQ